MPMAVAGAMVISLGQRASQHPRAAASQGVWRSEAEDASMGCYTGEMPWTPFKKGRAALLCSVADHLCRLLSESSFTGTAPGSD